MMPLFDLQLPANAQGFFNQIFKIASFDIIEIEPYILSMFHLNRTEPLNSNFDSLGFDSMYYLANLGPLLLAFLVYLLSIGLLVLIDRCVSRSDRIAKVQTYLYESLFYNSIVSIMMESYSLMACCVMINLTYLNWSSTGEIIQNTICLLSALLLIMFPLELINISLMSWERNLVFARKIIMPFFEELNMRKGPIVIVHPIYFLLRRLIMAAVVVFFRKWLFAQILVTALTIIGAVMLNGYVQALHTPQRRRFEVFNEVIIMLVLYNMICFSQFVEDPKARYKMGWACIVIVAFHLIVNMAIILYATIIKFKLSILIWFAKRKLVKQRKQILEVIQNVKFKRKYAQIELKKNLNIPIGFVDTTPYEPGPEQSDTKLTKYIIGLGFQHKKLHDHMIKPIVPTASAEPTPLFADLQRTKSPEKQLSLTETDDETATAKRVAHKDQKEYNFGKVSAPLIKDWLKELGNHNPSLMAEPTAEVTLISTVKQTPIVPINVTNVSAKKVTTPKQNGAQNRNLEEQTAGKVNEDVQVELMPAKQPTQPSQKEQTPVTHEKKKSLWEESLEALETKQKETKDELEGLEDRTRSFDLKAGRATEEEGRFRRREQLLDSVLLGSPREKDDLKLTKDQDAPPERNTSQIAPPRVNQAAETHSVSKQMANSTEVPTIKSKQQPESSLLMGSNSEALVVECLKAQQQIIKSQQDLLAAQQRHLQELNQKKLTESPGKRQV